MIEWNWPKAITLAERARILRAKTAASLDTMVDERSRKRLAKWKAQPPFESGTLFQQRLDQAGLTESELLELLAHRNGTGRAEEPPDWASEVGWALSERGEKEESFWPEKADDHPEILFLDLIQPLIARALNKLREGVQSLARTQSAGAVVPERAERLCLDLLPGRLLPLLLRTMALELNVARVEGRLTGATGQERFASFISLIRRPQVRLDLLREYPVMGRLVVTALENWVTCSLEFLQRCCADWPAIRDALSPVQDPGPLVRIQGDVGDRHRGGRTVWILECSSGFKVVYKPKAMAADVHFQELLHWFNGHGLAAPFRTLRILDRGDYGWEEYVSPHACSSHEEVARFYQRTGGYTALLYALAATDFHHGNVLAVGEHPVLIDLEALFHPSGLGESAPDQADEIAQRSFGDSVLGSGLLPVPIWGGRESGVFDLSGLGAEAGQKMPMRGSVWKEKGTDEMHFARDAQVIASSDHRPTLNEARVTPLDYLDEIETGFRQVYRLLETHRNELLAEGGLISRFAHDEVRVVLRDSSRYSQLLQEGSHPDVLRDGLDRDRLFDLLWEDVTYRPRLAEFIPAESQDLWRGDIPLFTTRPASRDLWAGVDRCFPDALNESGLDRARQRLAHFGQEDLERQLWFLRGSLTTLASASRPIPRSRSEQSSEPGVIIDRAEILAASCAVGDRLVELALRGSEDVAWIGLNLIRQKQWVLVPLGLDFYDGLPGIALFLAYLGSISGKERYTELARAALNTIQRQIDPSKRKKGFRQIGGFFGWGGLLYALTHLGVIWGEPHLLAEARELVEELPERIEQDKDLDIIGGAAGCIAGLLCLQSCSPSSRVLEVAHQCGERLTASARQMPLGLGWEPSIANHGPLTGFSHGAAGISWALLELSTQTREERFQTVALGGMAYERSLFSAEAGNWPDLRVPDTSPKQESREKPSFPVAWCHGAPGIGLARLLCRRLLQDSRFDSEIETALRTTIQSGFGFNQSLCHGELGNLELILEAARVWPSTWGEEATRLIARVSDGIKRDGWLCGNPLAVESPGLMTGLAGIGYGLLRCAEPVRVPSLLSLAPPIQGLDHAAMRRQQPLQHVR
jgi:type 2 lantibiotic biosynthesis protein LanM